MKSFLTLVVLFNAFFSSVDGFYLPGVAPHSFQTDEAVELKVNKLR
jgi:hypothetical protein